MRKTFCDRCGEECISVIGRMHLSVEHFRPSNRERVAEDEFAPVDLCSGCKEALRSWFRELGKSWPSIPAHMKEDSAYPQDVPESLGMAAQDLNHPGDIDYMPPRDSLAEGLPQ